MPTERLVCALIFIVLLAAVPGCAHKAKAPIAQKSVLEPESVTVHRAGNQRTVGAAASRPTSYVVQRGDTLYSIAWRFGVDYRNLARWNRLLNPNVIYAGQRLHLNPPPPAKDKAVATAAPPKPKKASPPGRAKTVKAAPKAAAKPLRITWSWPAKGSVKKASSALGTKGIEILGPRGEPIRAAASGSVVYAGSGLRGYGKLIIVKHSEEFLSAYAHNDRLRVAEGAIVNRGQQIAEMGDTDAKRVMLHFEIRRDGKAVAPLEYLPRR